MRLPYLQVTQEAWGKARELAALLGINRHQAMGLMLDLWAWALELGPPSEMPKGELKSQNALKRLAGALEYPGIHAQELADALQDVGLLTWSAEDGCEVVRVRGLDRYESTWKKRKADKERAALGRASQQHSGDVAATPPRVAGSDVDADVDVETKKKLKTLSAAADRAPKKSKAPAEEKPSPRLTALADRLCADYLERRPGVGKYKHGGAKDTLGLQAIAATGASDAEIRARWRYGLTAPAKSWLYVSTFAQLAAKWNDLAGYGEPPREELPPAPPRHEPPPPLLQEIPF